MRRLYDAEIAVNDEQFEALIEELRSRELLRNTIVVLVSDHGEEFLEHDGYEHGQTLYEEQLRVPLAIWIPEMEALKPRTRIEGPFCLGDLMPLLTEIVESPTSAESFLRAVAGLQQERGSRCIATRDSSSLPWCQRSNRLYGEQALSITDGMWKLIMRPLNNETLLFNLKQDPAERTNLAESNTEIVRDLSSHIMNRTTGRLLPTIPLESTDNERLFTKEDEEQLRVLGYIE
jgi:arylsulfatase A-like enzyme